MVLKLPRMPSGKWKMENRQKNFGFIHTANDPGIGVFYSRLEGTCLELNARARVTVRSIPNTLAAKLKGCV